VAGNLTLKDEKTLLVISLAVAVTGCGQEQKDKITLMVKQPTEETSGMSDAEYVENARLWAIKRDNVGAATTAIHEAILTKLNSPKSAKFNKDVATKLSSLELEMGIWSFDYNKSSLNDWLVSGIGDYERLFKLFNSPIPPVTPLEPEVDWSAVSPASSASAPMPLKPRSEADQKEHSDRYYASERSIRLDAETKLSADIGIVDPKVPLHYYAIDSYVDAVNAYGTEVRAKYTGFYVFNPKSGLSVTRATLY
jgi:hypothetical protein